MIDFDLTKRFNHNHVRNLKSHKYASIGKSILEPYLQIWWNYIINFIPTWIAPNALTLSGLVFILWSTLFYLIYSPRMNSDIPNWVNLFAIFAIFMYQTLDAIDGKQARRLNCSSPLGELFDHGCDAIAVFCILINFGCALKISQCFKSFQLLYWFIFLTLYLSHWSYYVTGSFYFTSISVTESQIAAMIIFLLPVLFGPNFYHIQLIGGFDLCYVILIVTSISVITGSYSYIPRILKLGIGKNGSSIANSSVISPVFPFLFVLLAWLYVKKNSTAMLIDEYPCEIVAHLGIIFGKLSSKTMISTMSLLPIDFMDKSIVNFFVLAISVYFKSSILEIFTLYATLGFGVIDMIFTSIVVCRKFSSFLNVPIFTVKQR